AIAPEEGGANAKRGHELGTEATDTLARAGAERRYRRTPRDVGDDRDRVRRAPRDAEIDWRRAVRHVPDVRSRFGRSHGQRGAERELDVPARGGCRIRRARIGRRGPRLRQEGEDRRGDERVAHGSTGRREGIVDAP